MNDDATQIVTSAWARRNLPARLTAAATASLLGFAEHDVQILMRVRKLKPLGQPAPNAPKLFASVQMIGLALDARWLSDATREVSKYWKYKRLRSRSKSGQPIDEDSGGTLSH